MVIFFSSPSPPRNISGRGYPIPSRPRGPAGRVSRSSAGRTCLPRPPPAHRTRRAFSPPRAPPRPRIPLEGRRDRPVELLPAPEFRHHLSSILPQEQNVVGFRPDQPLL